MLHIEITGDAPKRAKSAEKYIKTWIRSAIGDLAHDAIQFIKDNYLVGQALNRRSGLTCNSVKQFWVKNEQAWYLRPGVGVPGSQNYLARWIGTPREFMRPGFERYLASRDPEGLIAKKIEGKL